LRAKCLLPLANTPLIEYTFEFLANAGVEDVFLYCGAHTEQVEEYIKSVVLVISPGSTLSL
jgi:translation initiation factor eIF-2B subunit epsilon